MLAGTDRFGLSSLGNNKPVRIRSIDPRRMERKLRPTACKSDLSAKELGSLKSVLMADEQLGPQLLTAEIGVRQTPCVIPDESL